MFIVLGGAAGGIIGGCAAGAAVGSMCPGIGTVVGGIIGLAGGLIGGIIGARAGAECDCWIWNGEEDDIMNCYEFFGRHDVERGTRPILYPDEFKEAFDKALTEKKHENLSEEQWHTLCMRNALVLIGAMHPESKEILQLLGRVVQQCGENMALGIFLIAMKNIRVYSVQGTFIFHFCMSNDIKFIEFMVFKAKARRN